VFGNKVFRKIFVPEWDEVSGQFGILRNQELCDLNRTPSVLRIMKSRIRWTGNTSRVGERSIEYIYRILAEKRLEKRPLQRQRSMWEDNIKMDLMEEGYEDGSS
jgi:hypothetical protein